LLSKPTTVDVARALHSVDLDLRRLADRAGAVGEHRQIVELVVGGMQVRLMLEVAQAELGDRPLDDGLDLLLVLVRDGREEVVLNLQVERPVLEPSAGVRAESGSHPAAAPMGVRMCESCAETH
jgi:hypothetical protein